MPVARFPARRRVLALLTVLGVMLGSFLVQTPAHAATTVTADFSVNRGTGHAEVLGSGINHVDDVRKLDTLNQAGMRFARRDAYLSEILPNNITLDDYRNNVNNVKDPNTWDWSKYAWVDEYHARGVKILLIMSYNVGWLGHGPCCITGRVPRDWAVYEDIVQKIYQRFKGKVAAVEIWNEPNNVGPGNFLDLTGSPYSNGLDAYRDIYEHGSKAIRAVDPTIPIGGPVVSITSATDWADAILRDPDIPANNVNFLSYHHYTLTEPVNIQAWKQVAANAGRGTNFPVYVTEWNADFRFPPTEISSEHPDAISYTGTRMTSMLNQRADGAAYYADNDQSAEAPGVFFGIYRNGFLTPKSRTFRLLSHHLGLGDDDHTLRQITYDSALVSNAGAATTARGDQVAWLVNDKATAADATLQLNGLGSMTSAIANVYEASANQDVNVPLTSQAITVQGGRAQVHVGLPPHSVVGVRLSQARFAESDNLALTATAVGSSNSAEHDLPARNVNDGIIGVWGIGEWASNAELTPWVELRWSTPQTVGEVILFDRTNPHDLINGATLTFDGGSPVHVPALANGGTGKSIRFPARQVSTLRVKVDNGAGLNVGFSEIQAFRGANIASDATATSSSRRHQVADGHGNAFDGIVGQSFGEWVSTQTTPWIRLDWVNRRVIDEVVLYDRADGASNANGGTLSFSDGSSIAVSSIPAAGGPRSVSFPAREVGWVRFDATAGSGANVGLSELRVYEAPNRASSANTTASSQAADPALSGAAAVDGIVNQWFSGEWASNGQLTPTIQLTWPTAQTISKVVVYDRINVEDKIAGSELRFSDGSVVNVGALDDTGLGKVVTFAPKTVTSVTYAVTNGQGLNVGLAEIEAFG